MPPAYRRRQRLKRRSRTTLLPDADLTYADAWSTPDGSAVTLMAILAAAVGLIADDLGRQIVERTTEACRPGTAPKTRYGPLVKAHRDKVASYIDAAGETTAPKSSSTAAPSDPDGGAEGFWLGLTPAGQRHPDMSCSTPIKSSVLSSCAAGGHLRLKP